MHDAHHPCRSSDPASENEVSCPSTLLGCERSMALVSDIVPGVEDRIMCIAASALLSLVVVAK